MQGTITKLLSEKGYGFIKAHDGVEYFFHRSGVSRGVVFENLRERQAVDFGTEQGAPGKGPRAVSVTPAE